MIGVVGVEPQDFQVQAGLDFHEFSPDRLPDVAHLKE